jgi:diguanylate cyclase (GGDEF)-like protein/putative nucleotidyltransferase with HDIG domain
MIAPTSTETHDALAAVRRMSGAVLTRAGFDDIAEALMRELCTVLRVDQVHLQVVSQDAGATKARLMRPVDGEPRIVEEYVQLLDDRPSGVREAVRTGEPLNIYDARTHPGVRRDHIERWHIVSVLFMPLVFGGEVRAVLVVATETPRRFTAAEIELARTLANQAAAGIALRELESRRRIELEQQTALARAARSLTRSLELREILTELSREADLALDGDMAGVYLKDGESGIAYAGHDSPEGWLGGRVYPGEGVAGQVLVSGEPVVTNAYEHEVVRMAEVAMPELETAVSVPISWEGELKGALSVGFQRMRRIVPEDLAVLEAIADLAAMACRNAEEYERARSAARTDSLTGVLNHGAMHMRLHEEVERARRSGEPLTCLLLDLDDFKQLNDRAGHLAGDQILVRVATVLGGELRPYDHLARFGGDEFAAILPGVDEAGAREVAERLRGAVSSASRATGSRGLETSVGIAAWEEPLGAADLLERADRALLLAKRLGKGRVAVASPAVDHQLALLVSGSDSRSELMRSFWDMVAGCERPRDAIMNLPGFVRRVTAIEEVALYEVGAGRVSAALIRAASARHPADEGRRAFLRGAMPMPAEVAARMKGTLVRDDLGQLMEALGIEPHPSDGRAPGGAYAAVPLTAPDGLHGLLLLRSAECPFPLELLHDAEVLARQTLTVLLGQSGGGSAAAVKALAAAIDARDNYTHDHSEEVVALATELATTLGLPAREIERVRTGALLHDVGKVAIPNEILYKPGRLTREEWEIMRRHPVIGERILRRTPELEDIAPLVRHEHEHWDGSGYPDGIAGTDIPMGSRIILACDAYNAMITRRPYRDPMTRENAIAELERCAGTQFDPTVVAALVGVLAEQAEPVA